MFEQLHISRTCGFRFSLKDAIAIGVFTGAVCGFWYLGGPLWWMLLIAAGHFFLFCNVFRIVRRRELTWAGLFVLNVGIWSWFDRLAWPAVFVCQIPITVALIFAEMRSPAYHGVFARRLNPRLDDYLKGNVP